MDLAALLVGGHQVLAPVLRPLDRPAEAERRPRDEDLFGIEEHDLRPEAAAHVGRDHLHLELRQPEDPCEPVLDGQRRLRGGPHAEHAGPRVVLGRDPTPFDGAAAAPLDDEALVEDVRDVGP